MVANAGSASADTTITLRYPVTGSTHLAAPNATVPLGPGKPTVTADLTTYTMPQFHHCLLNTLLINLTLPGPGNTITLKLGKRKPVH